MRFIRKEKTTPTLCNEEINEEDNIRFILEGLLGHRIEFSIIIKKFFPSSYETKNIRYEKVRIKHVYDNSIDLTVFKGTFVTQIKDVSFNDIKEVKAISTIIHILQVDDKATVFDVLDFT